jgi:hypothetical protein
MRTLLQLALAFTLLGVGLRVCAQEKPFRWGLKAGLNGSRSFTKAGGTTFRPGYLTGLTAEYRFSPRWSLAADPAYSNQDETYWFTFSSTDPAVKVKLENRFLVLPVLVRFSPRANPFFAQLGLQGAYYLPRNGLYYTRRKVDVGLVAGAGYRLSRHWVVEARFTQGITSRSRPGEVVVADPNTGQIYLTEHVYRRFGQVGTFALSYFF